MEKSKKPKDTPFRQQNLKAWRPILTPNLVILLFVIVGTIFIPIGIAVMMASNDVVEVETVDYSRACCANCDSTNSQERVDFNPCTVPIVVPKRMEPPIYMYYKLSNYYQNHRRYVKSRSDMQLRGLDPEMSLLDTSCQHRVSINGTEESIINPCGLIAWSVFNDSYELRTSDGVLLNTSSTSIAWQSDIDMKFKNQQPEMDGGVVTRVGTTGNNFPPFYHERQQSCDELPASINSAENVDLCNRTGAGWCFRGSGYCNEDEHFIVWMRTAGLPTFRKLYAKLDTALEAGTYKVKVSNGQFTPDFGGMYFNPADSPEYYASGRNRIPHNQTFLYPVHTFDGTKSIVLSTSSWIGGKNSFLGGAYLTVGIICIVLASGFAIKQKLFPR